MTQNKRDWPMGMSLAESQLLNQNDMGQQSRKNDTKANKRLEAAKSKAADSSQESHTAKESLGSTKTSSLWLQPHRVNRRGTPLGTGNSTE